MTHSEPILKAAPNSIGRLASIDAYRGLVMFLMMAEVLHLCAGRARRCPDSAFWEFLCPSPGRTSSGSAARCTT